MVFNANIFQCTSCGLMLIAEELQQHECKKIEDYRIDGNILWVFDGIRWIPRKLSAEKLQQDNSNLSDADDTEPYARFCQVVV